MTPTGRLIAVAVNPAASFGARPGVGPAVQAGLLRAGHRVRMLREESADALRPAVDAAVAEGVDALVVVGGDGMVSLAVNALAGTRVPLGVVPSGTGNDMSRGLGIPLDDTPAAIGHLLAALEREPRVIDLGVVRREGTSTYFAGALSAGFDALVNERANGWRWPRGSSRYTLAILRELLTLKARAYTLEVDGEPAEVRAVLISVANNSSIGGGMRITPLARLDDGLLDLFVVAPLSRLRFLRVFPKVFGGTHGDLDVVTIRPVRKVRIDAPGVVAYADGERVGTLPVEIEVLPEALRVLA